MLNKYEFDKLDLIWFLLIPLLNINYIIIDRLEVTGANIAIGLDYLIPFVPEFVVPYVYWYIYVALGLVFILLQSRNRYMKTFLTLISGMCVCYVIFFIFPTEITRPQVSNEGIFNWIVQVVYKKDRPFNCFPSLHVLGTYIIMRYTKLSYSKVWFYYTQIVGSLIILSTVFIKQHFVLDIIGAIILSELLIVIVQAVQDKYIEFILNVPRMIRGK